MPALSHIQATPEEVMALLDSRVLVRGHWMKMSTFVMKLAPEICGGKASVLAKTVRRVANKAAKLRKLRRKP